MPKKSESVIRPKLREELREAGESAMRSGRVVIVHDGAVQFHVFPQSIASVLDSPNRSGPHKCFAIRDGVHVWGDRPLNTYNFENCWIFSADAMRKVLAEPYVQIHPLTNQY